MSIQPFHTSNGSGLCFSLQQIILSLVLSLALCDVLVKAGIFFVNKFFFSEIQLCANRHCSKGMVFGFPLSSTLYQTQARSRTLICALGKMCSPYLLRFFSLSTKDKASCLLLVVVSLFFTCCHTSLSVDWAESTLRLWDGDLCSLPQRCSTSSPSEDVWRSVMSLFQWARDKNLHSTWPESAILLCCALQDLSHQLDGCHSCKLSEKYLGLPLSWSQIQNLTQSHNHAQLPNTWLLLKISIPFLKPIYFREHLLCWCNWRARCAGVNKPKGSFMLSSHHVLFVLLPFHPSDSCGLGKAYHFCGKVWYF